MKKTAKLSLLIALAICITVGGVYAAWNYVNYEFGDATADDTRSLGVIIANHLVVTEQVPAGTIQVSPGRHAIEIDQDPTKEDLGHYGKITWGGQAAQVSYVPSNATSDGGSAETVPDTIDIMVTIEITGNNTYSFKQEDGTVATDAAILVIAPIPGTLSAYDSGEPATDNKKFFIINDLPKNGSVEFDLADYLFVSTNLCLPTVDDYTAFKTFLETANLKVNVSFKDVTTPAP